MSIHIRVYIESEERWEGRGGKEEEKSSPHLSIEGSQNVQVPEFSLVNTRNAPAKVLIKSWDERYTFQF